MYNGVYVETRVFKIGSFFAVINLLVKVGDLWVSRDFLSPPLTLI